MKKSIFLKDFSLDNRKARHDYILEDFYEAGIELKGAEVKSIRMGKVDFTGSYIYISDGEAYILEMNIQPYQGSSFFADFEPKRRRKLLLKKYEIIKIASIVKQKRKTIIPVRLYFNGRGFVKLQIAIASGKKEHDKRRDIKARDLKRQERREDL